jgi:hypothetical protein
MKTDFHPQTRKPSRLTSTLNKNYEKHQPIHIHPHDIRTEPAFMRGQLGVRDDRPLLHVAIAQEGDQLRWPA